MINISGFTEWTIRLCGVSNYFKENNYYFVIFSVTKTAPFSRTMRQPMSRTLLDLVTETELLGYGLVIALSLDKNSIENLWEILSRKVYGNGRKFSQLTN